MLWKDRIKLRDFSLTRTHKTKKKCEPLICPFVGQILPGPGWDIQVWGGLAGKGPREKEQHV